MATISGGVLGEGPVATVYSGLHDGVPVAVKVFPRRFDKSTLTALEKERATLAALSGAILPVEGVDLLAGGRHALRMPLCEHSLAALVERTGPLSAEDVVVLGRDVAGALAAAHGAGIVHGGVTPHNVLFRASGEPVLADAGVTLRHAFPRDPLHAIEFLPPETVRTGTLDEQTDLYGLGAVLHFALIGRSPHPGRLGEPPGERVLRVLSEPVPAINRSDVPVALSTVVARMLAVDPGRRPLAVAAIATQLAAMAPPPPANDEFDDFTGAPPNPPDVDEFDEFAHRVTPPPVPPPAKIPTPQPPRSGIRWEVVAACVGLLAVFGVVLFLALRGSPQELAVPSGAAAPTGPPPRQPVPVELADPVDRGDHVELSWRGSANVEFSVVVAPEGEDTHALLARQNTRMSVDIDPARKYCFQIRVFDGNQIYESLPKAIRGATCRN